MKRPYLSSLKGNSRYTSIVGPKQGAVYTKAGQVVLKPGESIGPHVTERKEEVILILEGKARFYYGRSKRSLIAGKHTVIYVPIDTLHDVKNIGRRNLRYIYVVSLSIRH